MKRIFFKEYLKTYNMNYTAFNNIHIKFFDTLMALILKTEYIRLIVHEFFEILTREI